jgi:hypothetical protein
VLIGFYWAYIPADTMSTKKGSQDNITTKEATTSTPISSPKSFLAEQHQSVNETLDETKNNINRTIEELGRDIPRKTQVINDYQEHTIQILTEIADSYLQSQKEIINSFQSAWTPYIENAYGMLYTFCPSPRKISEIYARAVSNFADNIIAITKLVNNVIFANVEASRILIQRRKEDIKELSRMGVNATRTFEHMSTDTAVKS